MTTKTYRNPKTMAIRIVDEKNEVQIAALLKLGWTEIEADDIANAPSLSVVHEKVQPATPPVEPPALPRLATPVPPAPTRETTSQVNKVIDADLDAIPDDVDHVDLEDGSTLDRDKPSGKAEKGAKG